MLFVFMSQPDYACNPHALYEYIKSHTDHETAWIVKKDEAYHALKKRGIECELYDTLAGNRLIARADYVVGNSYTFTEIPKREGQIFINLWHGSGIKAHDHFDYDMSVMQLKKVSDFCKKTDIMCVHSLDDRFRLSALLHYDIRKSYVTGQPRLDLVKKSDGRKKLESLFGSDIGSFDHLILFAPSFRANMSGHSGTFYSDNIFRLEDYDDVRLRELLEEHNAALVYKLHPIEQVAFSGREFVMNDRCFELTDKMLFENDIRYDEILNAFDMMVSDYSSIVFDYMLLDRPVIYLIPDYDEYIKQKGFVFINIDDYMPGDKAFSFDELCSSIDDGFNDPDKYKDRRQQLLRYRFDYQDDKSAERCYDAIMNYKRPVDVPEDVEKTELRLSMPSACDQLRKYVNDSYQLIDSTKAGKDLVTAGEIAANPDKKYLYITEEIPDETRRLSGIVSYEIRDLEYYMSVKDLPNVKVCKIHGGVDYEVFAAANNEQSNDACGGASDTAHGKFRPRIGFAGVIDERIYFAMVQCVCEAFPECDVIFAGEIMGTYPSWLNSFDNLKFVEAKYEELPGIIASFDVAFLPFYGRHQKTIPSELFRYLACGKQVVASNMSELPMIDAIHLSKSVDEAVENIRMVMDGGNNPDVTAEGKEIAAQNDWSNIAKSIVE